MAQRPKSRAVGTEKQTPKKRRAADEAVVTSRAASKAPATKKIKPAARKTTAKKAVASTPAKKVSRPKASATAPVRKTAKTAAAAKIPAKKATRAKTRAAARAKPATKPSTKVIEAKTTPKVAARKAPAATPRKRGRKANAATKKSLAKAPQPYLAAELGQPVDHDGEPIGAGSTRAQSDRELQEYALQLWRQMQSGSVTKRYMRSIERAGLTVDDIWVSGVRDTWPTSSTPDEVRRYRQKALFRANLLEAILSETVGDLRRLEGIEPTPAKGASEPA